MANEKINFTRTALGSVAIPTTGRVYIRDERARFLIVDVQSSGTKTFQVYRKVNGKPTRITLGKFNPDFPESKVFPTGTDPLALIGNASELNVKMARMLTEAVNASLDRGVDPAAHARDQRQKQNSVLTLRQAFDLYSKDHLIPHAKRTANDLCNDFDRYLGKVASGQKKPRGKEKVKSPGAVDWETRKLTSISQADVRSMMMSIQDGVGSRTANKVYVLLNSIYNKMLDWKLFAGDNPCDGIDKFKEVSRDRFVTGDEIPRFMKALNEINHPDFTDYVLLSLYTGMRRANVLALRWQDLNFDAGIITVPSEVSKNGTPLTIPITSATGTILERRKAAKKAEEIGFKKNPYVFPAKSTTGHMSPPNKRWKALLGDAGITDLRLHDLRRSLGSWAAMGGASLPIIAKMLGHSSSESTSVYARLQLGPVAIAMESATAAMLAAWKPVNEPQSLLPALPPNE
jgi:integrase